VSLYRRERLLDGTGPIARRRISICLQPAECRVQVGAAFANSIVKLFPMLVPNDLFQGFSSV
jgi:hypothetical protein